MGFIRKRRSFRGGHRGGLAGRTSDTRFALRYAHRLGFEPLEDRLLLSGTAQPQGLAVSALVEGPAAGGASDIVTLAGPWTATANASWLHTTASGSASGLAAFAFDANTGPMRTGTLTIAGQTLTVTQAGSGYVAANTLIPLISSPLVQPKAVAVDRFGNVYIADTGENAVKEWNAATHALTTLVSSGLSGPTGVAVDASGNVYIADSGDKAIKEWNAATQTLTTVVSSGLQSPADIAVDATGNVYLLDRGDDAIDELPRAFVPGGPISETGAAGSDALATVLPATASLTGVFAPSSDQSWLTIGSVSGGVVDFSFAQNTGTIRTAHITVLGQQITVNQAAVPTPPIDTTPPRTYNAVEGNSTGSQVVATFTDATPGAAPAGFSGTIFWGDGTASASFTGADVSLPSASPAATSMPRRGPTTSPSRSTTCTTRVPRPAIRRW